MGKLYDYFGFIGIASIVMWTAALVLLIVFVRSKLRTPAYVVALALALLASLLGSINSDRVSAIQVDRTQEMAEARDRQKQAELIEMRRTRVRDVNFAEDQPKSTGPASQPAPLQDYGYRTHGKVEREGGKKLNDETLEKIAATQPSTDPQKPDPNTRYMLESDVMAANKYDRLNLFALRVTLIAAIGLFLIDYFARFNSTLRPYFPLPIGRPAIDSVFPKTLSVYLQTSRPEVIRRYLEQAVRKGESFLYFGPSDPWPTDALSRLPGPAFWRLHKLTLPADPKSLEDETAFESAWLNRACVVFAGQGSTILIEDLLGYLRKRYVPGAPLRKTVSIVWNLPTTLPKTTLQELVSLCAEAHFKLMIVSPTAPGAEIMPLFQEHLVVK